jgi:formate-dependent nitrite reductase membrane component NrfD
VARAVELAATFETERAVSAIPQVATPLRQGKSSVLWRSAAALTAASLVLSLTARKSRLANVIAGGIAMAGSLCLRFAVHHAGIASARDPQAAFAERSTRLG